MQNSHVTFVSGYKNQPNKNYDKNYLIVPEWLNSPRFAELSSTTKILYAVLSAYCAQSKKQNNNQASKCWPSHRTLAHRLGGKSMRTVRRCLNSLEEHGLLITQKRNNQGVCNVYYLTHKEDIDMTLPTPKKPKNKGERVGQNVLGGRTQMSYGGRTKCPLNNKDNNNKEITENNSSAIDEQSRKSTNTENLKEVIDRVKNACSTSVKVSAERIARGDAKVDDLFRLWRDIVTHELGCGATVWTVREKSIMKKMYARFTSGHTKNTFDEFLGFSLKNWRSLIENDFAWMGTSGKHSKAPKFPNVGFLSAFMDRFIDAWQADEDLRYLNKLPDKQRYIETLKRDGIPQDKAVQIAEEREAEVRARAERNEVAYKLLQQAEEKLELAKVTEQEAIKHLHKAQAKENEARRIMEKERRDEFALRNKGKYDEDGFLRNISLEDMSKLKLPTWEDTAKGKQDNDV